MSAAPRKRVAVLISGRGSNMTALVRAAAATDYPAEIACVISNRADAKGLDTAAASGIPTRVVPSRGSASREAHEMALGETLDEFGPDIVCLAGYMRILSPGFVARWQGRMINIHPSLLPSFMGLDTHRRALETGVKIHGCTVHFVTREMDDGPIIAQAALAVSSGDTEESLAGRVLDLEHRLYPMALRLVADGQARMEGDRVVLPDVPAGGSLLSPDPAISGKTDIETLARMTP